MSWFGNLKYFTGEHDGSNYTATLALYQIFFNFWTSSSLFSIMFKIPRSAELLPKGIFLPTTAFG